MILSVIVPVYNCKGFLPALGETAAALEGESWELILVDDGSTDGSPALCDAYAQKDPRIRSLRLERNGGAGAARNRGLQEARGEYLLMLDSDDLFDSDMLERGLEALKDAEAVVWGVTEEVPDKNQASSLCVSAIAPYATKPRIHPGLKL
jgi:glycosyltransferase involved in cell wall biosynthesis